MEPEEKTSNQETPSNVKGVIETILHEDGPIIVTPTLGGGEIVGTYQGETDDGSHHVFKHNEGHIFHVPFFGQMDSAKKVAEKKGITLVGKIIRIVVLDIGRFLIKVIGE